MDAPGLFPAVFSFDEREPLSVIPVGPSGPLRAATADGEELVGVLSIAADLVPDGGVLPVAMGVPAQ